MSHIINVREGEPGISKKDYNGIIPKKLDYKEHNANLSFDNEREMLLPNTRSSSAPPAKIKKVLTF